MLQNKNITKTQEVKTFFKDTWRQPEFLIKHLELLNFSKSSHKRTGKKHWEKDAPLLEWLKSLNKK